MKICQPISGLDILEEFKAEAVVWKREKLIIRVAGDLEIGAAVSRRRLPGTRMRPGCGRKSKHSGVRREAPPHPKS
jgi:hypothetical protein